MIPSRGLLAATFASCVACSSSGSGGPDAGPCTARGLAMDAAACHAGDAGGDAPDVMAAECAAPEAGAASLSRLEVSASGDPSIKLSPAFTPGVYDYYVPCGAGENQLAVSATAASGGSVALAIETPASPSGTQRGVGAAGATQSTTLPVNEGQAIVATVTSGSAKEEYWVRCLPSTFPAMRWVPHAMGCARAPGYYLVGVLAPGGFAMILDNAGVPVWFKSNGGSVYDVESLDAGLVSFAGAWQIDTIGGATSYPLVDSLDGGEPASPDEHELRILPNGHMLALGSAGQTVDMTGLTLPFFDGGTMSYGPGTPILGCQIYEFDATGKVYWSWSATDHFDPVEVMVVKGNGDLSENSYVEPFHCNSIDVDPANGDLLISARHMDSVFYIDKSTGAVLWKLGGADTSKDHDHALYVPAPKGDPFVCQHDARLQPGWKETCSGGSGQVSMFDDESYTTNPARGLVLDVTIQGGCAGGPTTGGTTGATASWQYKNWYPGGVPSSNTCGGFRVAADGSRIVDWGQVSDESSLVFTEVDDKGVDLLDLYWPGGGYSYRAVKLPLSAFDLSALRASAGQ